MEGKLEDAVEYVEKKGLDTAGIYLLPHAGVLSSLQSLEYKVSNWVGKLMSKFKQQRVIPGAASLWEKEVL